MPRKKNWADRLDVMKSMGWLSTKEEWPHFLAAMRKECCLDDLSEFIGFDIPTIMRDMALGGYPTKPRQQLFVDGMTLKEYAKKHGVKYCTIWRRFKKGLPLIEDSRGGPRVKVGGKSILEWAEEWNCDYQTARRRLQGQYEVEQRNHSQDTISGTLRVLQKNCPDVRVNNFNKNWK